MYSWWQRLPDNLERMVFYLTFFIFVFIILVQMLMISDELRQYLSRVDALEGEPHEPAIGQDYTYYEEYMDSYGLDKLGNLNKSD